MKTWAVLMSLLLVAACGGGQEGAKAKAAFLVKAEKVCAKAVAEHKALPTPALPTLPQYVAKVVAIADESTNALAALDLPDEDAGDLRAKVIDPLKAQLADAHAFAAKVSAASKAGNQAELIRLLGDPPTKPRADLRWMKAYGFSACVEAADTSD